MSHPHAKLQPATTDADLLPVVDEHDREIDRLPRREVHLRELLHRAVHVCVATPRGELWLQLRARAKDSWGGYWDLSATGHVDPGESYEQAARRELHEELGLQASPAFVTKLPATRERCWEFHGLYFLVWSGPIPDFSRSEVDEVRAFSLEELHAGLADPVADPPFCPGIPDALPWIEPLLRELAAGAAPVDASSPEALRLP